MACPALFYAQGAVIQETSWSLCHKGTSGCPWGPEQSREVPGQLPDGGLRSGSWFWVQPLEVVLPSVSAILTSQSLRITEIHCVWEGSF